MPARALTPEPLIAQRAVVYARVSSKEQEQGYSISAQLRLLYDYAIQKGLTVEREFIDVETAKRAGRTGFNEMLSFLRKHQTRIVLVEKTDRAYRNIRDWVTLDEFGLELHLVKENVILSPDSRSSEKFMHGIKVLMAKNYIDNLSEETRKGMLEKARTGLWPSYAPVGYRNAVREDGKRIITPDPQTAPVITQLYDWFATGTYSLKDVTLKARGAGLRLTAGKLHKSEIHQVLRKRIYNGDFDFDGTTYHGTHTPLVSKTTWERVQELLDGKTRPHKHKHDFPYTGLVTCGHCGCQLVGEIKKGRYVYYHCTNSKGTNCPEPYTRQERLTQELTSILDDLVVPKPITTWLRAALRATDTTHVKERQDALDHATAELQRLQNRIDAMYLDKLDGRITSVFFDEKATAWRLEQAKLQARIHDLQQQTQSYDDAITAVETTSKLCTAFPTQPPSEQRRLLQLLIENASWKDGKFEATLKTPFQKLRDSNRGSQTNDRGNADGGTEIKNWLPVVDSNIANYVQHDSGDQAIGESDLFVGVNRSFVLLC